MGGSNFYKLEGFEIAVAAFVLATLNTIDCGLKLTVVKLFVSTGDPAPGSIEMAVIRKP